MAPITPASAAAEGTAVGATVGAAVGASVGVVGAIVGVSVSSAPIFMHARVGFAALLVDGQNLLVVSVQQLRSVQMSHEPALISHGSFEPPAW